MRGKQLFAAIILDELEFAFICGRLALVRLIIIAPEDLESNHHNTDGMPTAHRVSRLVDVVPELVVDTGLDGIYSHVVQLLDALVDRLVRGVPEFDIVYQLLVPGEEGPVAVDAAPVAEVGRDDEGVLGVLQVLCQKLAVLPLRLPPAETDEYGHNGWPLCLVLPVCFLQPFPQVRKLHLQTVFVDFFFHRHVLKHASLPQLADRGCVDGKSAEGGSVVFESSQGAARQ